MYAARNENAQTQMRELKTQNEREHKRRHVIVYMEWNEEEKQKPV